MQGYRYDAELVSAVMLKRPLMPMLVRHGVNQTLMLYMAYSGHYGIPEVYKPLRALELDTVLRGLL